MLPWKDDVLAWGDAVFFTWVTSIRLVVCLLRPTQPSPPPFHRCGGVFCDVCSRERRVLPSSPNTNLVRVCDACAVAVDAGEDSSLSDAARTPMHHRGSLSAVIGGGHNRASSVSVRSSSALVGTQGRHRRALSSAVRDHSHGAACPT